MYFSWDVNGQAHICRGGYTRPVCKDSLSFGNAQLVWFVGHEEKLQATSKVSLVFVFLQRYWYSCRFPKIEPLYFGDILPSDVEDVANCAHLLNSMLCFNPKTSTCRKMSTAVSTPRPPLSNAILISPIGYSIDEVLRHPFFDEIKEPVGKPSDYFEVLMHNSCTVTNKQVFIALQLSYLSITI